MHTQDIAASVPPITREYIHLAIQEALAPAIEEIYTEISRAKAMASKVPNISSLAAQVAVTVEASISNGISTIVEHRTAAFKQELVESLEALRASIATCQARADNALSGVEYLASNQAKPANPVDPTAAIEQAIAPIQQAISDINSSLASTKSMDLIASTVSEMVEASVSSSLASIIEQHSNTMREELDAALAQIQDEAVKREASAERLLTAMASLENRVRKWLDGDRYSITRSQVLKAMRDAND